jgi:hypothetical protein
MNYNVFPIFITMYYNYLSYNNNYYWKGNWYLGRKEKDPTKRFYSPDGAFP